MLFPALLLVFHYQFNLGYSISFFLSFVIGWIALATYYTVYMVVTVMAITLTPGLLGWLFILRINQTA